MSSRIREGNHWPKIIYIYVNWYNVANSYLLWIYWSILHNNGNLVLFYVSKTFIGTELSWPIFCFFLNEGNIIYISAWTIFCIHYSVLCHRKNLSVPSVIIQLILCPFNSPHHPFPSSNWNSVSACLIWFVHLFLFFILHMWAKSYDIFFLGWTYFI